MEAERERRRGGRDQRERLEHREEWWDKFSVLFFIGVETTSRGTVGLVLIRSTSGRTLGRPSEDRRRPPHYFSGSFPLLCPPYASSDDSFLPYGPSLDTNHEKTHSSSASHSRPSQPPQPLPPGLPEKLALVL